MHHSECIFFLFHLSIFFAFFLFFLPFIALKLISLIYGFRTKWYSWQIDSLQNTNKIRIIFGKIVKIGISMKIKWNEMGNSLSLIHQSIVKKKNWNSQCSRPNGIQCCKTVKRNNLVKSLTRIDSMDKYLPFVRYRIHETCV